MKKRYWLFIFIVLFFMISSVLIFLFKVSDSEASALFTSYLNNLYSSEGLSKNECSESFPQSYTKNKIQMNQNIQNKLVLNYKVNTGYNFLSSQQEKDCYKLLEKHCGHISNNKSENGFYPIEQFTIKNSKLSVETIKKVLYAIQNDDPDIFWIASTFSYQYTKKDTILKLYSIFSKDEKINAEKKLKAKEMILHNYIVNNCEYDKFSSSYKIFTCYGCLVENKAVCEGYSKAMQLLMNVVGINSITVVGSSKDEPHMWNIVKINDKCYHLDVTWDGVGGLGQYNYFNVNDEIIKKDHKINPTFDSKNNVDSKIRKNSPLPKCSELKDNYYEKNAVKISDLSEDSENKIIEKLLNIATAEKNYLYIKTVGNFNFNTAVNQLIKQNPYKLFSCIRLANRYIDYNLRKFVDNNIQFNINNFQNVLTIKLNYR